MLKERTRKISIRITEEQYRILRMNAINISKLCRDCIERYIEQRNLKAYIL